MSKIEKYRSFIKKTLHNYSSVSEKSIDLISSISRVQHFKKGEILLQIGKTSRKIHILYSGAVVSYYINKDGNLYHKNIFLEGNFVGSTVSALKNQPSDFALEVIEDATIISFEYKNYRQLIDQHTDLKDFYIAYLEKNWVIDKEKREIDIVLKDANERYLDYISSHPNIDKRIPLHYIASHLGITPTQLSRIRKKIKKNPPNQHM